MSPIIRTALTGTLYFWGVLLGLAGLCLVLGAGLGLVLAVAFKVARTLL